MSKKILERLEKLESRTPLYDRLAGMSYDEKKEMMRAYYSQMFNFDSVLSKDEYEDDLLNRFPDVIGMKAEPPKLRDDKDIKDMTSKEKHEAINAILRREAWRIAFKRRSVL